jgi:hypothetical protein
VERRQDPGPHDRGHQPGSFEGFFREVADLAAAGPPAFDAVATPATSYGLEFGKAEWLPDIIARYGLNPPPTP